MDERIVRNSKGFYVFVSPDDWATCSKCESEYHPESMGDNNVCLDCEKK